MLKSCAYCGRIHDSKFVCEQKKEKQRKRWGNNKDSAAAIFRKTQVWTNKSKRVRKLDNHLCLCCIEELPGTIRKYNTQHLQVHHIVPVEEDYELRLDEGNLITACEKHHEMCESGTISRKKQKELVKKYRRKECALIC